MRIEICGGIGAGKTTLAKLLGDNGFNITLENFKSNPFWEPFYTNPNLYNFETEITFLLQHYHAIKVAYQNIDKFVCDFSFYQDLAYAKMGLESTRLRIFEDIFNEGLAELKKPDLLICLQCSPETLLQRIKSRARPEEELIDTSFLSYLNSDIYSVSDDFDRLNDVLYIDSQVKNFATKAEDQQEVLELINQTLSIK